MTAREKLEKLRELRRLKCRRSFWSYCNYKSPEFYTVRRQYLMDICNGLQAFWESDQKLFIINMPPRHGKSRTIGNFIEWALGRNQREKIISGSYNEILSTSFSKSIRNTIMTLDTGDGFAYSDIFPGVKIKYGDAASNLWSLEGGFNNYLATSPSGTVTGFGGSILIIDDLIKSAYEANNAATLEAHWTWFTDTMLSRLEEGGKIIIIATRWHTKDLCGRLMSYYDGAGRGYSQFIFPALLDNGNMLCDDILSRESFEDKKALVGDDIFSANYQQEPIDIKGRLYSGFLTYDHLPVDDKGASLFTDIRNYTDTADTGGDYLCSICYGVYERRAYVLDVLYTREAMEITEGKTAAMLTCNGVKTATIESNNGGRGFARAVERLLGDARIRVDTFHQSKNKQARILSNATAVMDGILFPIDWKARWSEYYRDMYEYQREGKNAHDDAPDATTGVIESLSGGARFDFN